MKNYSKSLLQFCEKRLNETIEDSQLNKVFYFRNSVKNLKIKNEMVEEIIISLNMEYSLLHSKKKDRIHSLCD